MPWIKDKGSDKTASEEIFGMKSDEVLAQLKAGAEAKTKLDELQTSFSNQFNEIKEALGKLQVTPGSNSGSGNNNNGGNNNGGGNNGGTPEDKAPDWFADPDAAFSHHANKMMAPLVNLTLQTRADSVFDRVKSSIPDFALFEDEIRKEIDGAAPQYKANEQYVRNAYHMIKGRHADEIANDRAKGSGKYFVESATTNLNSSLTSDKDKKTVLTQDEKDYAAKFDLTEEQYIASKKGLKYV